MSDGNVNRNKAVFTEWLEKLQQESWQLELLISGLALFGVWGAKSLMAGIDDYLSVNSFGEFQFLLTGFRYVMRVGWIIFFTNLLLHIIFRGLWIAAIGLRYVSGDIDYEQLDFSDIFQRFFKKAHGSFDDYIERLEKISSMMFAFTFLLFFLFLSIFAFFFNYALVIKLGQYLSISSDQSLTNLVVAFITFIYFGLGLLVFLDFITLSLFKKIKDKIVSRIYFYIYRFYSLITLSFLYRSLLYNFIDNKYTRNYFLLAIPYGIFLTIIVPSLRLESSAYFPSFSGNAPQADVINSHSFNWQYYDDLRPKFTSTTDENKTEINGVSLESYDLSKDYTYIFLRSYPSDDESINLSHPELNTNVNKGLGIANIGHYPDNAYLDSIEQTKNKELVYLRRLLRNKDYTDEEMFALFPRLKDQYANNSIEDYADVRMEITNKYDTMKTEYIDGELRKLKTVMKGFYDVKIDQIPMNDSLECEFFLHPNLKERGLICYFSTKHLSPGRHIMDVQNKKKKMNREGEIVFRTKSYKLPFRMNR